MSILRSFGACPIHGECRSNGHAMTVNGSLHVPFPSAVKANTRSIYYRIEKSSIGSLWTR
ncbi:MAG TPA: hypothetical protein VNL13_00195 [Sulfolobales archaeon]|nr:hypothetical protein [Sulfolobales archaeon]